MKKNRLFDEFQEASSKGWKQKIQSDLRGEDYNDVLLWEAPEGIVVKPFYHEDDLKKKSFPTIEHPKTWNICQAIFAGNAILANKKALDAINRGAENLVFSIPSEKIKISELLQGLDFQSVAIHFDFHFLSTDFVRSILDVPGIAKTNLHLNIDTIGHFCRSGNWHVDQIEDQSKLKDIATDKLLQNVVGIDTALYQNAGANIVQQLAYGLAHANEYLNQLANSVQPLKTQFTFKIALGGNYFFEIAKLRALRVLWKSLTREYGIEVGCHIMASPSKRNKTIYDYNTNMLRTTMESMAAVLGGADFVCNLPYDFIYHKDNEFGERIARNQLLLLKNESHLDKVSNAAEGSYYIEKLSLQLAEKALALFKSIEAGGGFLKQLKAQTIQNKIRESAFQEQQLFDADKEVLIGTNVYQNKTDAMKDNLELHPFVKTSRRKTLIEPIIEKRLAEKVEQDRLRNE